MTIKRNDNGTIEAITNDQQPRELFKLDDVEMVGANLLKTLYQLGMIQGGAIVGSVRRRKAFVKDLELLVVPKMGPSTQLTQGQMFSQDQDGPEVNLFNEMVPTLLDVTPLEMGDKDGPILKTFVWPWPDQLGSKLSIEIYQVPHQSAWGVQMVIRTGPLEFNKFLMSHVLKLGYHSSQGFLHGHGKNESAGYRGQCQRGHECTQLINCPTEEKFFQAIGLEYILPAARHEETLQAAVRKYHKSKKKGG